MRKKLTDQSDQSTTVSEQKKVSKRKKHHKSKDRRVLPKVSEEPPPDAPTSNDMTTDAVKDKVIETMRSEIERLRNVIRGDTVVNNTLQADNGRLRALLLEKDGVLKKVQNEHCKVLKELETLRAKSNEFGFSSEDDHKAELERLQTRVSEQDEKLFDESIANKNRQGEIERLENLVMEKDKKLEEEGKSRTRVLLLLRELEQDPSEEFPVKEQDLTSYYQELYRKQDEELLALKKSGASSDDLKPVQAKRDAAVAALAPYYQELCRQQAEELKQLRKKGTNQNRELTELESNKNVSHEKP
jgi:hypothetical protein